MKKVLIVRSVAASFRRAGMAFSQKPRTLVLDDLTTDQVEALESEPNLVVKEGSVADDALAADQSSDQEASVAQVEAPADTTSEEADNKSPDSDSGITLTAIVEAIAKLESENTDHWTTGGKPQVKALEGLVGGSISADLRDEAFEVFTLQQSELNAGASDSEKAES